jgi:hypothetical protein
MLDAFKKKFSITKDIGSLRRKGVSIENVLDALNELYDLPTLTSKRQMEDGIMWAEHTKTSPKLGYYYGSCSLGGIPSGIIGCSSKVVWDGVRDELRARGLIR